jgi:hypothetical protein
MKVKELIQYLQNYSGEKEVVERACNGEVFSSSRILRVEGKGERVILVCNAR